MTAHIGCINIFYNEEKKIKQKSNANVCGECKCAVNVIVLVCAMLQAGRCDIGSSCSDAHQDQSIFWVATVTSS